MPRCFHEPFIPSPSVPPRVQRICVPSSRHVLRKKNLGVGGTYLPFSTRGTDESRPFGSKYEGPEKADSRERARSSLNIEGKGLSERYIWGPGKI